MQPLVIFDLDGTLSLADHRRHLVENGNTKWTEFYAAAHLDRLNYPVARAYWALQAMSYEMWIFSGRSDEVEVDTTTWLNKKGVGYDKLRMRRAGDYTPDNQLKRSWYDDMSLDDKRRLVFVFDDRDKVVAMWRSLGIACFQVAPGGF